MKKQLLAFILLAIPFAAQAGTVIKELDAQPLYVQTLQVQIANFNDCKALDSDPIVKATNMKVNDFCAIDIPDFKIGKAYLIEASVNGKELAPYVGNRDNFKGHLVYFKNMLPATGPITFTLKVFGEKKAEQKIAKN
jgi:hypothetical protein